MGVRRVAVALFACALVATALAQARPALGRAQHAGDIARIEAPREPGADGLAGMTLEELMQELDTPALSIAVVRDFEIAWVRALRRGRDDPAAGRSGRRWNTVRAIRQGSRSGSDRYGRQLPLPAATPRTWMPTRREDTSGRTGQTNTEAPPKPSGMCTLSSTPPGCGRHRPISPNSSLKFSYRSRGAPTRSSPER